MVWECRSPIIFNLESRKQRNVLQTLNILNNNMCKAVNQYCTNPHKQSVKRQLQKKDKIFRQFQNLKYVLLSPKH